MRSTGVAPRLKFTKKLLLRVEPPPRGRLYFYDTETPHLLFQITENGARSFYVYRRVDGRPSRIRLGGFPELTVEQARKKAERINGQIAHGEDPQAKRRAASAEMTLGDLWKRYEEHAASRSTAKTRDNDERLWRCHLETWSKRRLSDIRRVDAIARLESIAKESGKAVANRALQLLRRLYNYARDHLEVRLENPAVRLPFFEEKARDRFLTAAEMPAFFESLEAEPDALLRDFFKLCLFTGARRGNVQAMRWEELDLESGVWRIPESKNGEPLRVTLSPVALEILKRRGKSRKNGSPWVFPSRGKTGHLTEPKSAWKRLIARAGITGLRIHDLRRTLGSWQAAGGAGLPIIGKSLGHRSSAATAIYARLDLDPVRQSVNVAVAAMLQASKKKAKKGRKEGQKSDARETR